MAYSRFGLSPADVVTDPAGNAIPGRQVQVWDSYELGSQILDLQALDGSPLPGVVTTDTDGRFPFRAPETSGYWMDDGQNPRWFVPAVEAYGNAELALSLARQASDDSADAQQTAQAARDTVTELEASLGTAAVLSSSFYVVTDASYGAVGDGTTDDYNAIQNALTAASVAGGGYVLLPGGRTYVCSSTLRWDANTKLVGLGGATLASNTGMPLLYNYTSSDLENGVPGYSGKGDLVCEGVTFDMRAHLNTAADIHNCVTVAHAERIVFRNCRFLNVKGFHALEAHSVKNMLVEGCWFEGYVQSTASFPREAVQIDSVNLAFDDDTPCADVHFRDCYFGPSQECGGWGRGIGSHTSGATSRHHDITITGCVFEDTVEYGVAAYSWDNSAITGNTFRGTGSAAILVTCAAGNAASGLDISGNLIDGTAASAGVQFNTTDSVTRYSRCTIDNNTIRGTASNGIYFDYADRSTISNNHVAENVANYGIQVGGGASNPVDDVLVVGNYAIANATAGYRANNCRRTTWSMNKALASAEGVRYGNTLTDTLFAGNDLRGCTTGFVMSPTATGHALAYDGGSVGDNRT